MSDLKLATLPIELAEALVDPLTYTNEPRAHAILTRIRNEIPVGLADVDGYDPFWVVSKHADIKEVTQNNKVFLSGGQGGTAAIQTHDAIEFGRKNGAATLFRSIAGMNAPEHMRYRLLTFNWFQPKNLRPLEDRFRAIAREFIGKIRAVGGEVDFAADIARFYPLRVIMSILGVPVEDQDKMLPLAERFAQVGRSSAGTPTTGNLDAAQAYKDVISNFVEYFRGISKARQDNPTDDLASIIANAQVNGERISERDAMGYYVTIATAGHDTTSSTMSDAIWELARHPDQFEAIKKDRSRIPALVEEAVRWSCPVKQFIRTAGEDYVLRGQKIRAGEIVLLIYPSGNRDEEVFEDPFKFKSDRSPNPHIGFGFGAHMCLGMHVARMEMRIFLEEFFDAVRSIEITGEQKRLDSYFLAGATSMPMCMVLES